MRLLTPLAGKGQWFTPLPAPVPDLGRSTPNLIRPEGRPIWQLINAGFNNPWLWVPQEQNLRLYEQLVKTVPILNAAIARIVQLVGQPCVEAEPDVKDEFEAWMRGLSVNKVQTGFHNWFQTWLYDHLLYGRAHGEIILPASRRDIYALQELHTRTIELRPDPDLYSVQIVQMQINTGVPVTLNNRLILTAVHDVHGDSPQGNSLLDGLPFVAEIITSMMKDLQRTWERFGTPTYHIQWKPPEALADPTSTRSQSYLGVIMARWSEAMKNRANGDIQDYATAGDIEVKVVGAEGEMLDFTTPFRTLLEQVVCKTGLPPMLLGIQWQAGERIGAVQAALVTEIVDAIRGSVGPEIEYLFRLRQTLAGKSDKLKLGWKAPTLIDAFETSRARLLNAQAESTEVKTIEEKWRIGVMTRVNVAREMRPDLSSLTDEEMLAELPDLLDEAPAVPQPMLPGQQTASTRPDLAANRSLSYGRLPAKNGRH